MSKMIAVFEVEFESNDMWNAEPLKTEMDNDWLKAMKFLYENDDMGIFSEHPKLVAVKRKDRTCEACVYPEKIGHTCV